MRKINLDHEKNFENLKNTVDGIRSNQSKFYWAVDIRSKSHLKKTLLAIKNKRVLEIGCSSGVLANDYAGVVASYLGIDISDQAIKIACSRTLPNTDFICTDGHHIPAPDNEFDYVIVNSLLHHLNLRQSFPEIYRVLKPGGGLIFKEPLGTNPIFQLYRFLTPSARTPDEKPFDISDLKLMKSYFQFIDVSFYGFTNLLSGFIKSPRLKVILTSIDDLLARTPIKYFFWQFAGIARKNVAELK